MKPTPVVIILAFLSFTGCAPDGGSPPSPVSTTALSAGTGDPDASTGPVDPDTTAGDQCEEFGLYQCRGWVAGLYQNNGVGNYQFFNLPGDVDEFLCIDDIVIPMPLSTPDNQMLFDACIAQCELEAADMVWPASHGTWEFSHAECVFDENGNDGYLLSGNVGVASCDWIHSAPHEQQVLYTGPATGDDCAPQSCGGWDPDSEIAWSFNTRTLVHTTAIDPTFMDEVYAGRYEELYACDSGRWQQTIGSGNVETWAMSRLVAGEFLYRMGFRSGDHTVTIRRAGSSTYTTYTLNSFPAMADAFELLQTYNSFVVTFRRPVGSTYQTHTMNLTL